jgi:phosphoenolpyruvate synthase/pyruvate phosphate dikinase
LRAGLPVPGAVVLEPELVRLVADGDPAADRWSADLAAFGAARGGRSRSARSPLSEDGDAASLAGQHVNPLGVRPTSAALRAAVATVHSSAAAPHALAYRNALQVAASREIAILAQPLVTAEASGVLFTGDPVTGADKLVVEAARGLGDVVVGGLVTPDRSRIRPDAAIIERRPGHRSAAIVAATGSGTDERLEPGSPAPASLRDTPCLA